MPSLFDNTLSFFGLQRAPGPSFKERLNAFANPFANPTAKLNGDEPERKSWPEDSGLTALSTEWGRYFFVEMERLKRYKDYDIMDTGSLSVLLDALVDACFIADDGALSGFKVYAKNNPRYTQVMERVVNETGLTMLARDFLRQTVKYGDNFVATISDGYSNIVAVEEVHPREMRVKFDERGRLRTGIEGGQRLPYWQVDPQEKPLASWSPDEMSHLKYAPVRRAVYSDRSFLEALRPVWHKLNMQEQAVVVMRLLRASTRFAHLIDVTGKDDKGAEETIKRYRELLRKEKGPSDSIGSRRQENRYLSVTEDFFIPVGHLKVGTEIKERKSAVQMLDPNLQGLRYLPDLEYFQQQLFSRAPASMVGIPSAKPDIDQQDIATARMLQFFQVWILEAQLIKPILVKAIILKFGGMAQNVNDAIRFEWPNVIVKSSWRSSDAQFRKSMADTNRIEQMTISRKHVAQREHGFTDAEWDEEKAEILKERDVFGAVPTNTQAAQVRQGNNSEQIMTELFNKYPDFFAYLLRALEQQGQPMYGNGHKEIVRE